MTLECGNCSSIVGMEDPSTNGWRLLKANVSLNTNVNTEDAGEAPWQNHPAEVIIAAQLLELIERESARRFVVHCGLKHGLLVCTPRSSISPELRLNFSPALGLQSGPTVFQCQFWPQCSRPAGNESVFSGERRRGGSTPP